MVKLKKSQCSRPLTHKIVIALVLLAVMFAMLATVAALLAFIVSFARIRIAKGFRIGRLGWVIVGLIVVMAVVIMHYVPSIADRVIMIATSDKSDHVIFDGLLGGRSTHQRLEMDLLGIDLIAQRPWLGWGPDVTQLIGMFATDPSIKQLTQFHNGYIQNIVSFGIIGQLPGLALIAAVLIQAIRSGFAGLSAAYVSIGIAMTTYLLISNLTESILYVKPAAAVCTFFAMCACLKPSGAVSENRFEAQPASCGEGG